MKPPGAFLLAVRGISSAVGSTYSRGLPCGPTLEAPALGQIAGRRTAYAQVF